MSKPQCWKRSGPGWALEVELQASRRDPYRLMSRLFHIIGRRLPSD
jgi:hypothetical protein